jgi:release factor glutamine methyltransferase
MCSASIRRQVDVYVVKKHIKILLFKSQVKICIMLLKCSIFAQNLTDLTFQEFRNFMYLELADVYSAAELRIVLRQLTQSFCGLSDTDFLLSGNNNIHECHLPFLLNAVERLRQNEPLEYVTGKAQFHGLSLWVNGSVLIPRPETEEMTGFVELFFSGKNKPAHIIDLGTGSGCLALTLKKKYPEATVTATDISQSALTTARFNANAHQLDISFQLHDMLKDENLPVSCNQDLIISNPPYVLHSEMAYIHNRVKDFEPDSALYVPDDNPLLYFYHLKDYVLRYLQPGGFFIFEINSLMSESVRYLFSWQDEYIQNITLQKDTFGTVRFLSGRKLC